MGPSSRALGRSIFFVGFGVSLAGSACRISTPIDEQHPSIRSAPASLDSSPEETRATLLRTASADLACSHVEVVLTLERRFANTASARYVVEGCGKRALYAETCEAYPSCRYLVLSVLVVAPAPVEDRKSVV